MNYLDALNWLRADARYAFFATAVQFINWEGVEGDILEFGVATGRSLALLSYVYHENLVTWRYGDPAATTRRLAGFDSFAGLPPSQDFHPRWTTGSFAANYNYGHPVLAYNEPITPESIRSLFSVCGLPRPDVETGLFSETLAQTIPNKYQRVALAHIDSDLYPSAKEVLTALEPVLSDGALLLFDDWFMYRGNPNAGEARALKEFLEEYPQWQAIQYHPYSAFCNSFIMHKREP